MIHTIQEFIAAHKLLRGDDIYSNIEVVTDYEYVISYRCYSEKLARYFSSSSPDDVLDIYKKALDGLVKDFEIVPQKEMIIPDVNDITRDEYNTLSRGKID